MSRTHIGKWFGKGKRRESPTFPLQDTSVSQATAVDDTIQILSFPLCAGNISKKKIGMFELSTNEREKTIDVVAVHGLQGDAYKTWEHENSCLWLRDLLPAEIPNARIMTFGYDSSVAFSKSVAKIRIKHLNFSITSAPSGLLLSLAIHRSRSSLFVIA